MLYADVYLRRYSRQLLTLLVVAFCPWAQAEFVPNLYQAEVLVTSQSERARNEAAIEGLTQVLVKVTGSTDVLSHPELPQMLKSPQRLLEAFRYETTAEKLLVDDREVAGTRLVMTFSSSVIERFLKKNNVPILPANRPSVLVWVVEDSLTQGRYVLASSDKPDAITRLRQVAKLRGLPLLMPLMDLQDRVSLSADQLWNMDADAIRDASARYQADAVVVVRFSQTSTGRVLATWWLSHQNQQRVYDSESDAESGDWITTGVGEISRYLASVYAIVNQPQVDQAVFIAMEVGGVENFKAYKGLLDYLGQLAVINRVQVVSATTEKLSLHLFAEGDTRSLLDALALDKKLLAVAVAPGESQAINPATGLPAPILLHYQWQ